MAQYTVYATRWDDPHVVEELIPARGLSFSMPLSDHGECSFTATVEPGRSLWRASITTGMSGILVARDGQPVWSGWVRSERPSGPRSFQFTAREWGSFFATTPARVYRYAKQDPRAIFRDLIDYAQTQAGQNVNIDTTGTGALSDTTWGGELTDLAINSWDNRDTESAYRIIAEQIHGPEWYFGTTGTLASPKRTLMLGLRLGSTDPVDTLSYVEDTEDWAKADGPPSVTLLSNLFPAGTTVPTPGRRGGNVLAMGRTRDIAKATTVAIAVGDGSEAAQVKSLPARANRLIDQVGWPSITRWFTHTAVANPDMLQRLAAADLAHQAGIATGYELVSFDQWTDDDGKLRGGPDWTQVPRGSNMRVSLDTDVFAGPRPLEFTTRVLGMQVDVADDGGPAQVKWSVADTLETT